LIFPFCVGHQDGKLSHYLLTLKPDEKKRMVEAINRFSTFMNAKEESAEKESNNLRKKKPYTVVEMNQDLEYLHDLLIKPIAHHLCQMKLQHKLTLAPTEVNLPCFLRILIF
jgi:phosphoenolpyruvate carboxylase